MTLIHTRRNVLTIEGLIDEAVHQSATLADNLRCGRDTRKLFPALTIVLRSLPLAQGEFAWAECRLTNAAEYLAQDERHAAAWEIRLLSRRLRALNQNPLSTKGRSI
jgi:hypothetical protein